MATPSRARPVSSISPPSGHPLALARTVWVRGSQAWPNGRFCPSPLTKCRGAESLLEEQFSAALRGLHYRFDQRDTQLPFFELEYAVNSADRGRGHRIFALLGMVALLNPDPGHHLH